MHEKEVRFEIESNREKKGNYEGNATVTVEVAAAAALNY